MASPVLGQGRITRKRYWQLVAEGVIGPDDRVELLEGVIVAMSPQNPPHALVIAKLNRWLSTALGAEVTVRIQLPLDVGEFSTPEPDVAVVAGCADDFAVAHPTSALLVVEIADSTLVQDRMTKGPMYAAAGIAEYWIVNLRTRTVEIFRGPIREQRHYAESQVARSGERITVTTLPALSIAVDEILPPA